MPKLEDQTIQRLQAEMKAELDKRSIVKKQLSLQDIRINRNIGSVSVKGKPKPVTWLALAVAVYRLRGSTRR